MINIPSLSYRCPSPAVCGNTSSILGGSWRAEIASLLLHSCIGSASSTRDAIHYTESRALLFQARFLYDENEGKLCVNRGKQENTNISERALAVFKILYAMKIVEYESRPKLTDQTTVSGLISNMTGIVCLNVSFSSIFSQYAFRLGYCSFQPGLI